MNPTVKITPASIPSGKLADAAIYFHDGIMAGLKLCGFGVWARRGGERYITFPARQYSVNGERRSFALLRPASDHTAQDGIRALILDAYADHLRVESAFEHLEAETVAV